ncbi:hypothetical protein ACIA5D_42650 [Actinoplanes sp. NPDC051513]|uniref:hypothetical protein n=1 Tax=Actinoplanes sp. NPDC051513 TaxID=3363908 RepID=UPI00378BAA6D
MTAVLPLPAPHDAGANPGGLRPTGPTRAVVRREVRRLLSRSAAFDRLPAADRISLEHHLNKVAGYAAECVRDDWASSARLGQRPVLIERPAPARAATEQSATVRSPRAPAAAGHLGAGPLAAGQPARAQAAAAAARSARAQAAEEFTPAAAGNIAGVTAATLRALSFPDFVADLIRGTFNAIVNSSIQQLEAYARLLEDVSKTVDQFMADNITDNQARDWLVQAYPQHIALADGEPQLVAAAGSDDAAPPDWKSSLMLSEDVQPGDEDSYEEVLLPAARRKLAQSRLQTLSTLVLMGMNRIVVTAGKIRAAMSFHVDTTDRAGQQHATDFDFHTGASGSVGFGPWAVSASMSVGYVRSDRSQSDSQMNVSADLTGEVEIHFRTDAVPMERFIEPGKADVIRGNTAVPEYNDPPWGDSPPVRAPVTAPTAAPAIAPLRKETEAPPVPKIPDPNWTPDGSKPPAKAAPPPAATKPPETKPPETKPPEAKPPETKPPAAPGTTTAVTEGVAA